MVLYFSATGNTKFIAEEIAARTGDASLDLLKRIRPPFICDLIRNTPLEGNKNIYFVFTSGGYSGICSTMAKRLARKKGLNYMGSADFKMPRNYIANSTYPELSEEEIRHRIDVSYKHIPEIARLIKDEQKLVKLSKHVWLFEILITVRKCANLCPLKVIRPDENGRPVWDAKMCAHCMSCIQNCPVEAIDYGDITPPKKRYTFGRYDFRKTPK